MNKKKSLLPMATTLCMSAYSKNESSSKLEKKSSLISLRQIPWRLKGYTRLIFFCLFQPLNSFLFFFFLSCRESCWPSTSTMTTASSATSFVPKWCVPTLSSPTWARTSSHGPGMSLKKLTKPGMASASSLFPWLWLVHSELMPYMHFLFKGDIIDFHWFTWFI